MNAAVLGTVGAAFVVFAVWALYSLPAYVNNRRIVAASPGAIVLATGCGSAMNQVLDDWSEGPAGFPLLFSLVATPMGIVLRKRADSELLSIPWRDVASVTPMMIQERARTSNGVQLAVRSHGAEVLLPFIILGRGPFGSFPERTAVISRACAAMESWRLP